MKDKNISDKEKLLDALSADEVDFDKLIRPSKKQRVEKDSLFGDSVFNNHHATSYKDIHQQDSLNHVLQAAEAHKFNMLEELINNEKKKEKDRKLVDKLVDRSSTSQKKMRPKSSKGLRGNHVKVNTMGYINHTAKQTKGTKLTSNISSNIQANQIRKQGKTKKFGQIYVQQSHGASDGNNYSEHGVNFVRPNSSNDCREVKTFNSIKTPKENNRDKIAGNNAHDASKLNESKSNLMETHNNLLQNSFHPTKPFQSRNISTNLTYVKSQGSNLEGFSFFKPNSAKGDILIDKQQRKQKSKKTKIIKKLPYEEIKDKLLDNYNVKAKVNKTVLEDRFNMISNISKATYLGESLQNNKNKKASLSRNKNIDQARTAGQEPLSANKSVLVHNRKLLNANYKDQKKQGNKNGEMDMLKQFMKMQNVKFLQ